jgi:hypothetical protein
LGASRGWGAGAWLAGAGGCEADAGGWTGAEATGGADVTDVTSAGGCGSGAGLLGDDDGLLGLLDDDGLLGLLGDDGLLGLLGLLGDDGEVGSPSGPGLSELGGAVSTISGPGDSEDDDDGIDDGEVEVDVDEVNVLESTTTGTGSSVSGELGSTGCG